MVLVICEQKDNVLYKRLFATSNERLFYNLHLALQQLRIDAGVRIIIIDCSENVESGLLLLKEIKNSAPEKPAIFITGSSSESAVVSAFRLGARDFFKKPFNHHELLNAIQKLKALTRFPQEKRTHVMIGTQHNDRHFTGGNNGEILSNISTALAYIFRNISQDIYLEKIAEAAGMSRYHFCRVFKKNMGMTPNQYVLRLRIDNAKRLLLDRNCQISHIAMQVGFNTLTDFVRVFKKHTGDTPSKFRGRSCGNAFPSL